MKHWTCGKVSLKVRERDGISQGESGQRSHRKRMKERRHIQGEMEATCSSWWRWSDRWAVHTEDFMIWFSASPLLFIYIAVKKKKNNTFLKRQRQLWVNSFCEQMKYKQYVSDNKELHVNLLNDLFFSLFLLQLKPSESVPVITDKTISEDPLSTNRRLPL